MFGDLLEIATYVYCADQIVTRGGAGVDNLGANWRRIFYFRIPVRELDLWRSDEVREFLRETLGFLTDDHYEFDFRGITRAPQIQEYFSIPCEDDTDRIDEVSLFSCGLDSLSGAVERAVVRKKRVALVTHQSTTKLGQRYDTIKEGLIDKSRHSPLFVPVKVNKNPRSYEFSQRSRTFLFAALAAAVAHVLELDRICFFENGVTSCNFPLSEQVVGTKATRSTHPKVLEGFGKLFSKVTGRPFEVENPFFWDTKTDVVKRIVDGGCAELITPSVSCAHVHEMTREHPHCGSCTQCIDRRFGVLGSKAEEFDLAESYKVDLLVGPREDAQKRTILATWVEAARGLKDLSATEFLSRYGEATRVLPYLKEPLDAAALRLHDLHQRHGRTVWSVLADGVAEYAQQLVGRTLPKTCLLRLVPSGDGDTVSERPIVETREEDLGPNVFQKSGKGWLVRYAGRKPFFLLGTKGAAYIFLLILEPYVPIPVAKLASTVAKQRDELSWSRGVKVTDEDARKAYRTHLLELERELEVAQRNHDEALTQRVEREKLELLAELRRVRGRGGSIRAELDDLERFRKSVGAAIRRTMNEIKASDSCLWEHLKDSIRNVEKTVVYEPTRPAVWEI